MAKTVKIDIEKVTILTGSGSDRVLIKTTLESTLWPFNSNATLTVEAASGKGYDWVKTQFGIEPEVVNIGSTKD